MGQNNQKDQKGPKMTAAVMLVQNNQNNQKNWSPHISHTILKVRFFWDTLYLYLAHPDAEDGGDEEKDTERADGGGEPPEERAPEAQLGRV